METHPEPASRIPDFPSGFKWGVATSAAQIEGGASVGGRAPSVWDTFAAQPGRIAGDGVPAVAVDHYNRFREDIALMKNLGLQACRFSVSWSRIQPDGRGPVNPAGMDFYSRLVDTLLDAGIEPWITLYHWDLPQALQESEGGWLSKTTAERFGKFSGLVAAALGDRVKHFFTINEFFSFIDQGYADPVYAPGLCVGRAERNRARHNALLGHGYSQAALRSAGKDLKVGLAENPRLCQPVMETPEHIAAARKAFRELNGHYLTAIMEGAYPDSYLCGEGEAAPQVSEGDFKLIGAPLDFLALNAYTPVWVRGNPDASRGYSVLRYPDSYPRMGISWLLFGPQSCYWPFRFAHELWHVPELVVGECGAACNDVLESDGTIMDTDRILFLRHYLEQASRAIREGVPIKAFFHWTLMDNFEWACGFSKRFGLYYTRHPGLTRIPKLSADYYRNIIRTNQVL